MNKIRIIVSSLILMAVWSICSPTPSYAGQDPQSGPTLRVLEPYERTEAVKKHANRILKDHGREPLGTGYLFFADGKPYFGRLERHYHRPGGTERPWGYHVGVTVYAYVFPK